MGWVSPYLVAIVAGFFLTQVIKTLVSVTREKGMSLRNRLFISGGMPSSHSATIVAVWTVILIKDGWQSGVFGLASAMVLIVLYDAVKVRRSSGEQGMVLRALLKEQHSHIPEPRVAMGHTPAQVVVGALVGIVVGLLSTAIFN